MGVSMLPRLAASVCRTTVGMTSLSSPADFNTMRANGTKVMSDTSLVTTMLKKKGANTSTAIILRELSALFKSLLARKEKSPAR